MQLTYVPLLEELRELYRRPRDLKRFKAYLHMTVDSESLRVKLPTLSMNPMAKEHVGACLDAFIALDADRVGEDAVREAEPALRDVAGSYRVALVVCDDAGGWTNRVRVRVRRAAACPAPARPGLPRLDHRDIVGERAPVGAAGPRAGADRAPPVRPRAAAREREDARRVDGPGGAGDGAGWVRGADP